MTVAVSYPSPLGEMLLTADTAGLTGLWFVGQKYFPQDLEENRQKADLSIFQEVKRWLDIYFSGREPDFMPPLHLTGTPFQKEVWDILLTIPYGKTLTYGDIANQLAAKRGLTHMSAQAVGGAVGRNPVSIIVPCHRCVGSKGQLTGYAGGIDKKKALLALEKADILVMNK